MAKQRYTTEEIIHKLREADVLIGQEKWPRSVGQFFIGFNEDCPAV